MARKTKDESLVGNLCALIVDHQIGISVNLLLLLLLTHLCFPRARQTTRAYFELSYRDPVTGQYTQGWNDVLFVSFWVVVFTGLRAFVMDYVLAPLGKMNGITKKKAVVRFCEQAWLLIYDSCSWSVGMYIMYHSKYWFNLHELWTDFPTRSVSGLMKWYYLVQLAFWLQQILVVNIEEKRKDYAQMFTHHIITSFLIIMSYGYYQTKVGNMILCIMDGVDILLEGAKVLRYLNYRTACDVTFGVFILTWFATRHVLYLMICWSIHADVPTTMPYGCYDSNTGTMLTSNATLTKSVPFDGGSEILSNVMASFREPGGVVCFNNRVRYAFLALLLGLQVITILWFTMILKVAYKVISGHGAEDVRSDDEEDEDVESESEKKIQKDMAASTGRSLATAAAIPGPMTGAPLEEEVGVEELHLGRRTSPGVRVRRTAAGANGRGASMSSSRDRKELLGRIGCDGPS